MTWFVTLRLNDKIAIDLPIRMRNADDVKQYLDTMGRKS